MLALLLTDAALPARALDGFSERVVVDPVSGIAIFGYDPVGYFLEGRPVAGRVNHEARWREAIWRFASVGNREAFARNPDAFAPAYGGYDADGVARGAAVVSDPTVFSIAGGRLFLFRSLEARDRFVAGADTTAADQAWPRVEAGLRP